MPTVYFDESANTGENLLDPQQPVFALAAVRLSEEEATAIIQSVLPRRQGEPKFSTLVRSPAGRDALLCALESLPEGAVFTFLAHKRFMTVAKMVDLLAVELAYENGYDMCGDGAAVALANFLYVAGPVLGDSGAFEHMLATFVNALRPGRPTTLTDLFEAIAAYRATTTDEDYRDYLYLLEGARDQADSLADPIDDRTIRDVLDPAVPCLVSLCRGVAATTGPFHLVHDQSKTIARHVDSLRALPPVAPGQVLDFTFADSAVTPSLQIADWVAGATRHAAAAGKDDRITALADRWIVDSVWPNTKLIGGGAHRSSSA
jgi:Protein of unknown function (DUF3800)